MNSTQRKFLVDKIQEKVTAKIESLKKEIEEYPSIDNFIFKAILNDKLEIQPHGVILWALKQKAMKAKSGENWLSDQRLGMYANSTVRLDINDIVIVPSDYRDEYDKVLAHNKLIVSQINELKIQRDTIEVRIQLASDKTLQKLINEVDDMGDISLIDTKIKLLQ